MNVTVSDLSKRLFCFRFLLSFNFDWKDISNTQDRVCQHFQTPESSSKNTPPSVVFSTLSKVFGNVVKHSFLLDI